MHVTAEIALSAGTTANEAHTLATPLSVSVYLICKTTELGYAVDELVPAPQAHVLSSVTATNVYVHQVTTPTIPDRGSSNALTAVTPANWSYIAVATSR